MSALRVYLLRHGVTQWNLDKRVQGRSDIVLLASSVAALEARRLPEELQHARWHSSPLARARQTAMALGADTVAVVDALIEMNWGEWEGQRVAELRERLGAAMRDNEDAGLDFRPPGGESPREVGLRASAWLVAQAEAMAADTPPLVAVTHKGVIRAVFAELWQWNMLGRPPAKLDWSALHEVLVWPGGRMQAGRINIPLPARSSLHESSQP